MNEEFLKIFNKTTTTISLISTALTSVFGIEWILFFGYLVLNIFDYITGTIKSKVNNTESSNKGLIGIIKKVCYWILICISFLISFLLVQVGIKINFNLDFVVFFGWFTLVCLIINETRSIIENLIEIGINVPSFLTKGLDIYTKIIDSKINETMEKRK